MFSVARDVNMQERENMIVIKNILVPTDFSEPSRRAAKYGLTLASQLNAGLTIAHVIPDSHEKIEHRDRALHELQRLIPPDIMKRHNVRTIVRSGDVETQLLDIVKKEAADIVVMGTRGRRNPGRWFLGSVTEHMLRKSPAPMLTVSHVDDGAKAVELGLVVLRRILYATDLSVESQKGLRYAIQLARTAGAHLTAVHVATDLDFLFWGGRFVGNDPEVQKRHIYDLHQKLQKFVAQQKPDDMDIETLVPQGKAYDQILALAEQRGADMIVLNLQNKDLWNRAMLGATAERVVRLAHVPVFSVPAAAPNASAVELLV
jgi:nucleotide-binding universal stress UspA family protein